MATLARRRAIGQFDAGPRPMDGRRVPSLLDRVVHPVSTVACADTDDAVIALTYDDGPDPRQTPPLLETLADAGAPATFFLLSDRAEKHPDIVRDIVDAGHEVALHGTDHTRITTLPTRQAAERMRRGKAVLEDLTGREIRWYRPAYGAQTLSQVLAAARLGLTPMLWSGWASDWEDTPVETAADRAASAVHPGCVLLLHDSVGDPDPARPEPSYLQAELTQRLLGRMADTDYRVESLSDMIHQREIRSLWFNRRER